jgi:hypothetical protein
MQLERTIDAITEAVIAIQSGKPAPDPAQVTALRQAIQQLNDDVSAPRSPDDDEILAQGVLAPITEQLDTAYQLLREAAPDTARRASNPQVALHPPQRPRADPGGDQQVDQPQ